MLCVTGSLIVRHFAVRLTRWLRWKDGERVAPPIADSAPTDDGLTDYDREHLVIYLRLLDAAEDGADWREVAKIVLGRDSEQNPERVRQCHDSHRAGGGSGEAAFRNVALTALRRGAKPPLHAIGIT
jgi:hypothetical protein